MNYIHYVQKEPFEIHGKGENVCVGEDEFA